MTSASRSVHLLRAVVAAALVIGAREARAQLFAVSGSPPPLVVGTATAGFTPLASTDNSTTYTIFAYGRGNQKVTAQLSAAMPAGVTLKVQLAAPGNATSLGLVALSTVAQDVVTGVNNNLNTRSITYELSATLAAGVVARQSRTVTLTLIATP